MSDKLEFHPFGPLCSDILGSMSEIPVISTPQIADYYGITHDVLVQGVVDTLALAEEEATPIHFFDMTEEGLPTIRSFGSELLFVRMSYLVGEEESENYALGYALSVTAFHFVMHTLQVEASYNDTHQNHDVLFGGDLTVKLPLASRKFHTPQFRQDPVTGELMTPAYQLRSVALDLCTEDFFDAVIDSGDGLTAYLDESGEPLVFEGENSGRNVARHVTQKATEPDMEDTSYWLFNAELFRFGLKWSNQDETQFTLENP